MIISSARKAIRQVFAPRFRSVVWKSIGLTVLLFFGMWFGLDLLAGTFLAPLLGPWPWMTTAIAWLLGAGVIIGAGFLLAPTAAVFAGLFLDDIAETVEESEYPEDMPGTAVPMGQSIWLAVKFTVLVICANLLALLLVLLPGINFAIFFLVNGYLLGREYFQFAAMRHMSEQDANLLRKQHELSIFLAGLIVAGIMSIPLINIFTPIFAAIMMVHLHKAATGHRPVSRERAA